MNRKSNLLYIISILLCLSGAAGCACHKAEENLTKEITLRKPVPSPDITKPLSKSPQKDPNAQKNTEIITETTLAPTQREIFEPTISKDVPSTKIPSFIPTEETASSPTKSLSYIPTKALIISPTRKPSSDPTKRPTSSPEKDPIIPVLSPVVGPVTEKETILSEYILEEDFAKKVSEILCITKTESTFTETLIQRNILQKSSFKDAYICRKDAFYTLMIADRILNPERSYPLEAVMKNECISDLSGLTAEEQNAVLYVYAAGIVEGVSDGEYMHTRKLQSLQNLTQKDALCYLQRLTRLQDRKQLSFDGQLIRTEGLPEFSEWYPYILDCFPNEYYAWEFQFMKYEGRTKENLSEFSFVAPSHINSKSFRYGGPVSDYLKEHGNELRKMIEKYLLTIFNVDFRETPKDNRFATYVTEHNWYPAEPMCDGTKYGDAKETFFYKLSEYLSDMKENHTTVECDKAACDLSTIYMDGSSFYIRCYVHYRFLSADSVSCLSSYRNPTIFTPMYTMGFGYGNEVKNGEWRDGYFDVRFAIGNHTGDTVTPYVVNINYSDYKRYSRNIFK